MKLLAVLTSLLFTSIPVFSQTTFLAYPQSGVNATAGSQLTLEVARTPTSSSITEIGLVIAMEECPNGACFPASEFLGRLLYNGPFNPQGFDPRLPSGTFQNFTVTIPDFFEPGLYQLNVYDSYLLGASSIPVAQFSNITVNLH